MKKSIFFAAALLFAASAFAKDVQTVVFKTAPEMHCQNCEKKIKSNLRFEKGVKSITTDLNSKTVTIEYDAEKNTPQNMTKAFGKIGYKATVVETPEKAPAKEKTAKKK